MRPLLAGAGGSQKPPIASVRPLHRCRRKPAGMKLPCRELGLIAAAGALLADQGSKLILLYGFGFASRQPYDAVAVLPFFNLRMVWNRGVSYGLFQAGSRLGSM